MKILICNELYAPYYLGGAERSVKILAENLVQNGHEVYVYTTGPKNSDEIQNNVQIFYRKCKNIYWIYASRNPNKAKKLIWHLIDVYNFSAKKQFEKILNEIKPDIVHINVLSSFSVSLWSIAKKYNIPIVQTLRDYYLLCLKSTMFKNNCACHKQCVICKTFTYPKKYISSSVSAVVGISKFILDIHLKNGYFSDTKIKTVIFNSIPQKKNNNYNLQKERIIGYIGRIHPSKGIELLIENFLKIENLKYKLHIAGDNTTEYAQYLQKKYKNPNIQFLGIQDSEKFLSKMSLLVVPSIWNEPFGRVIIEAFNCNCPVIVSNRGGMPELITPQVNGDIFHIENPLSLKKLLQEFNDGKTTYTIDNTPSQYSVNYMIAKYEKLYQEVLNCPIK